MKSKYRIVRDEHSGYISQKKPWWFPFLWYAYPCCSKTTIEGSEEHLKIYLADFVVKYLGKI